jgi:FkbM family methyltransferase
MGVISRIVSAIRDRRVISSARSRLQKMVRGEFNEYLEDCHGVIHVGANEGQEREFYARHGLSVVWIEPIPEVYERLVSNIAPFPNQRAIRALITDKDGDNCVLHVSNNDGQSSSILGLHMHRDIWPEVHYIREIAVTSATLPSVLSKAGVNAEDYDALILDTQGSELLVLRGAESLLPQFRYLQVEAADFESYKGGATVKQIVQFLSQRGFRLRRKESFYPMERHPEGGRSFELLFKNASRRIGHDSRRQLETLLTRSIRR